MARRRPARGSARGGNGNLSWIVPLVVIFYLVSSSGDGPLSPVLGGDADTLPLSPTAPAQDAQTPATDASTGEGEVDPSVATTLGPATLAMVVDPSSVGMGVIVDASEAEAARGLIDRVVVAGPSTVDDYDRDAFGAAWADVDGNGCDTRNDILRRDLTDEEFRGGTNDCVATWGIMFGPYTGRRIEFVKADAGKVQIDHVVSLSAAWRMGAREWTGDRRRAFANDPLNLLASDGSTNQSKSDRTPSEWMPPNGDSGCSFSARYAAVSIAYALSVAAADRAAMTDACS